VAIAADPEHNAAARPKARRRPPAWALACLALGSVLIALLVVEGAVRARQWLRYGSASGSVLQFVTDPESGLRLMKPGLDTGKMRIDRHGFRNPELAMPKPPGRIRLAFLGASTTLCAEVSGDEATWPHLVARTLAERFPEASFDYVNAGQPGYDVESSLRLLRLKVAPLEPDVVLYYEATNDFSGDARELARRRGLFSGKVEDPSPLAKVSTAWYLIEKNLLVRQRSRQVASSPRLVYDADSLARGFEARLVAFLSEAREIAPVHAIATFSHKLRREQSSEARLAASNTSLYYAPFLSIEGLLEGWDAYNEAIRAAARETGAVLIEKEDSIPGDDVHFIDSVHFLDPGSAKQAERVVEGLVTAPAFQALVRSRSAAVTR
jgi:lysophospholipase L1-like esterase